jgi:hypothetical protein
MTKPETTAKAKRKTAKGGRPKAARVRDHWISFRVTAEEHFQLIDKAHRSSMGPGDYARSRAMRGIARSKKSAQTTDDIFGEQTRDLYHEIRKQGVLLNQIAKHCNTHQVPPPLEFLALADTLETLWRKLAP